MISFNSVVASTAFCRFCSRWREPARGTRGAGTSPSCAGPAATELNAGESTPDAGAAELLP